MFLRLELIVLRLIHELDYGLYTVLFPEGGDANVFSRLVSSEVSSLIRFIGDLSYFNDLCCQGVD